MDKLYKSTAKNNETRQLSETEYLGLLNLAKSIVDAKKEYAIVKEQEETKRLAISTDLTKYLAKLNAQKELLEKHLSNEFKLRKETIAEIFTRLDTAIDKNSEVVAAAALSAIHSIVATNPLTGISEIKKILESDDGVLEI